MIFMCQMDYGDWETIKRIRPKHRAYIESLRIGGNIVAAGSFVPDDDGDLFLYEAKSIEEARRFADEDPYIIGGAIRGYKLREFEVHAATPSLLRIA